MAESANTCARTANNEIAIELKGVWKIFGKTPLEAHRDIVKNGISKQEVLKKYDCVVGVADVDLQIKRGEIFCIMGLSGSGKSTLVRHINRLLDPTVGEVHVSGRDIMSLNPVELRTFRNQHISMVFQNFALMPHLSIVDNVALPLEIRNLPKNHRMELALNALKMVELEGWSNKFPYELSGGMQQRVGLARALASDAEVLLMDEPFSALDPLIRRQLQGEFMRLAALLNKTTVFITHDLDEAVRLGDRVAIMRDGRIIQTGTAEEIVLNPADAYVEEFVAGIARFKLVRAYTVMQAIGDYELAHGKLPDSAPTCDQNTNLGGILIAAARTDMAIAIIDASKRRVGVIDRTTLLAAIAEGMESEPIQ